jgi:hypothetical protein
VWERFLPEATAKYDDEMKKYNSLKGKAKRDASEPTPRMIAGEDEIFLQFATALKLIVGRSIRMDQLDRIKSLLQGYLLNYKEVCRQSIQLINLPTSNSATARTT